MAILRSAIESRPPGLLRNALPSELLRWLEDNFEILRDFEIDEADYPVSVLNGGTGATTAAGARSNLGLGTMALQDANSVTITGGSFVGGTDILVADGGTGSSTASGARTNLGVAIGSNVQAWDPDLDAIAALVSAADRFPYSTGVASWSLATLTAAARTFLAAVDAAAERTVLGLGTIATQNANSVTITGGSFTGGTDIAVADGGTGASTASAARTNLGLAIGSDVQAYDPDLVAIAALVSAADTLPYATGAGSWALTALTSAARTFIAAVDAAAQRTALGLGTIATQAASSVTISGGAATGLTDVETDMIRVADRYLTMFRLVILNNAGTIQHRIQSPNVSNTDASNFAGRVNSASVTAGNTPNGTDSSTAFATGGKVGSPTSAFVFDTADQTTPGNTLIHAVVSYNDTGTDIRAWSTFNSRNVNGTTRTRPEIRFFDATSGATWVPNTTNITSGKQVIVDVWGYWL